MIRATGVALLFVLLAAGCGDEERSEPPPAPTPEPEPGGDEPGGDGPWLRSVDPPAAPGSIAPSPTSVGDVVWMTWIEPVGEGHRVRVARFDGSDWAEPRTVVEGGDLVANWADFPMVARAADGSLYVSYLRRNGEERYAYAVELARAADGDGEFTVLGPVHDDGTPTEHGFVSMLPEDEGVRVFWLDGRAMVTEGAAMSVRTAHVGPEIGPATILDDRTCDCCQTSAVVTDAGPLLAYRDRSSTDVRDISIVRAVGDGWSEPRALHADGWEIAGCPVNGPALDARGAVVVAAWYTGASGADVRVSFSTDAGRSFGAPTILDGAAPLGRVDVVLLEDGRAAVSWLARAGESAEIRIATVSSGGAPSEARVVARTSAERASGFPRLVRSGDRLLVTWVETGDPGALHAAIVSLDRAAPRRPTVAPAARPSTLSGARFSSGGEVVTFAEVASERPVVLAFWASWCAPCRRELALLGRLAAGRSDLSFVAVSLDDEATPELAREWGFEGRVVSDAGLATRFGVPPLPATVICAADGTVRSVTIGEIGEADLRRAVADAVREHAEREL